MTELNIQDADGNTVTSIELFDDVYRVLRADAALRGVSVEAHIVGMIYDATRRIATEVENT